MPLSEEEERLITYAHEGNVRRVRNLLRERVDVNAQGDDGYTALMAACRAGYSNVVKELLLHARVDVNVIRRDGLTALEIAREHGHDEIVGLLEQRNTQYAVPTHNPQASLTTNPFYIVSCHGTYLSMSNDAVNLHVEPTSGSTWRWHQAGESSMFPDSLWIQNLETGNYLRGGYGADQHGHIVVDWYHEHWDFECWWTEKTTLDNGEIAYYIISALNKSIKRPEKYLRGDPGDPGAVLLTKNTFAREKWRFVLITSSYVEQVY
jgi:hypothetical protein